MTVYILHIWTNACVCVVIIVQDTFSIRGNKIVHFNSVMYLCLLGTKHKTILEARSGLGPIKAYPRLGPKPSGEQGGGATDPNTQERTFHCEICNVRVNSELQLKQVREQEEAGALVMLKLVVEFTELCWSCVDALYI